MIWLRSAHAHISCSFLVSLPHKQYYIFEDISYYYMELNPKITALVKKYSGNTYV